MPKLPGAGRKPKELPEYDRDDFLNQTAQLIQSKNAQLSGSEITYDDGGFGNLIQGHDGDINISVTLDQNNKAERLDVQKIAEQLNIPEKYLTVEHKMIDMGRNGIVSNLAINFKEYPPLSEMSPELRAAVSPNKLEQVNVAKTEKPEVTKQETKEELNITEGKDKKPENVLTAQEKADLRNAVLGQGGIGVPKNVQEVINDALPAKTDTNQVASDDTSIKDHSTEDQELIANAKIMSSAMQKVYKEQQNGHTEKPAVVADNKDKENKEGKIIKFDVTKGDELARMALKLGVAQKDLKGFCECVKDATPHMDNVDLIYPDEDVMIREADLSKFLPQNATDAQLAAKEAMIMGS